MVRVSEYQKTNEHYDKDQWLERICAGRIEAEADAIKRACELAVTAHKGQRRVSGEPYVEHVFAVTDILYELGLDSETLCAAILHDVIEDTSVSLQQINDEFGESVAMLVDGVTKMALIHDYPTEKLTAHKQKSSQAENLRKLLLAMVDDVRVVLIKLADRLHNMRTLSCLEPDRQERIAQETMDIFAPLANRLGIWQIKWELEDLALRYIEPVHYKQIAALLNEKRLDRERYIEVAVEQLQHETHSVGIEAEIEGRPKHIYSIWKKMKRKHIDFDEVYDVRAVRILVDNVRDCYAALGIVHGLWRHFPKEFDDYIATPKENNYQSLHTAVIGPDDKTLEIQIRTNEMHEHSELGVAAHWRYKEGSKHDANYEEKINWLRQVLEWKDEEADADDFIDRFKAEVFQDRVYVLTPQGKVIDLSAGATPLDFAYVIHTDVGHRCRGAKVDGHIVPLTYELKSGEQVDILTTKTGNPSRDWLNLSLGYLKTSRAKAKVRTWFKQLDQDKNIADGKHIVDKELSRIGVNKISIEKLASAFKCQTVNEFLVQVGRSDISISQLVATVQEAINPEENDTRILRNTHYKPDLEPHGDVKIYGVGNLLTSIAKCCQPVPNDAIVGFITRGRGVTIHRQDCSNILSVNDGEQERLIEVSWETNQHSCYPVDIKILAYDRRGLLGDITTILNSEKVNVVAVNTMTDVIDHMARMEITLEIMDITQLSRLLVKINQLPNIVEVKRK
ncbi:Inactive (p)ppGpp 3'-pyrophosphohydrolase domain / GTP pyrophosphokinase, (p)ppGpp synthetase I [hydrothermal vent metagenome]|uniref:Inactive (P)ppGpp 3'-pyrophosphohydrolase domain / GTP pyrophosphokinase, (P)ppGpp synthetase I n=1 Tax=hydrothermal vent metagenome TaxID=652676 RepID=A0A3B0YNP3_9ZZZZ